MDLNTCFETTKDYHIIAYYSHLIPVAIALFLGFFAYLKSKGSYISLIFASFSFCFSLWLLGDLVSWVSPNYDLVYFTWSWLDLVNIVFFIFGAYFFSILARGLISPTEKWMLALVAVPAFIITALGASVINFDQSVCEAINSTLLTQYKLAVEGILVMWMLYSFIHAWKYSPTEKRIQHSFVLGALLLFFSIFAGTEYFSSVTGIYEINLYSLFVLPVFLIVMVFAITNLGLFNLRFLGTQILSYSLILMTGSQLFFVQDATHTTLAIITLAISMVFGVLLLQNAKKEESARMKIEELAKELEKSNASQVTLIHFITHQIKGFVAKSRNIFSMALEGDFGAVGPELKPILEEGFRSDTKGATVIQEILNAANIKSGKMAFAMAPFDLRGLIEDMAKDLRTEADEKHLALNLGLGGVPAMTLGDRAQLVNVFKNLIDNSIKYTPSGKVDVSITLKPEEKKVLFAIKDTGVGITSEDMENLFTEGGHGKESVKVNVDSTGFGLYIVKNIVDAHNGRVWAESEGPGKGSQFYVELPAA